MNFFCEPESKEESKSKHSQFSEDYLKTFKHKRATSNTRTDDKTIIYMNKIREAREFELYKKSVYNRLLFRSHQYPTRGSSD